jgi:hypothetical protein
MPVDIVPECSCWLSEHDLLIVSSIFAVEWSLVTELERTQVLVYLSARHPPQVRMMAMRNQVRCSFSGATPLSHDNTKDISRISFLMNVLRESTGL